MLPFPCPEINLEIQKLFEVLYLNFFDLHGATASAGVDILLSLPTASTADTA